MAYILPTDNTVPLQIAYKDRKGNAATVDGDVVWSSSDDTICKAVVNPNDSTKAALMPGANLGNAQISATADADLGEGVQQIITPFDVTVVAGSAVAGTITPGESTPILKGK